MDAEVKITEIDKMGTFTMSWFSWQAIIVILLFQGQAELPVTITGIKITWFVTSHDDMKICDNHRQIMTNHPNANLCHMIISVMEWIAHLHG